MHARTALTLAARYHIVTQMSEDPLKTIPTGRNQNNDNQSKCAHCTDRRGPCAIPHPFAPRPLLVEPQALRAVAVRSLLIGSPTSSTRRTLSRILSSNSASCCRLVSLRCTVPHRKCGIPGARGLWRTGGARRGRGYRDQTVRAGLPSHTPTHAPHPAPPRARAHTHTHTHTHTLACVHLGRHAVAIDTLLAAWNSAARLMSTAGSK